MDQGADSGAEQQRVLFRAVDVNSAGRDVKESASWIAAGDVPVQDGP